MPKGEMNFFSKDILASVDYESLEEYLEVFSQAPQGSIVGEKSVWYLYSKIAIPSILELNSDAKFIVMIRNPIEMAPSLHSQNTRGSLEKEDLKNFKDAWYAQKFRKKGERIPRRCNAPKKLQYGEICRLGEQLERLYTYVPRERVHTIFLEDMKKDALKVYRDTLMFLGIPYDGCIDFPVINRNEVVVYPRLQRLLYIIKRFKTKYKIPSLHLNLLATLIKKTKRKEKRKPLQDDFKQELAKYFNEDIQKLSQLTGRDLSYWTDQI